MSKNFKPHLAYLASAGSGKTFALSARYLSLLFLGVDPNNILTATFTNKSALEMKHRIVDALIHLSDDKSRDILNKISEETGIDRDEILAKQPEVLERFLTSSKHIVTLDSFFSSILHSASLYLDIEPDFTTKDIDQKIKERSFLDEIDEKSLLPSLVELVITMDMKNRDFTNLFNIMQNLYRLEPILPKIDYKIDNLSKKEQEIDTQRELLLQLVIDARVSNSAIRNFEPIDIKNFFKKSIFAKSSLYKHRLYKKYLEENPQIEVEFLRLKEMLKEWADIKEKIILHNLFKLFDYYKNANITTAKSLKVLSFDDLTFFTCRLLLNDKNINREFLYFKMDTHFQHILLDEFQDTSTIQFLLLEPLIKEIFGGIGQSEFRSFFYVGDTKQSLYRFRGGVEELFNKVAKDYNIETLSLDTNYRSYRLVVEQINRWFEPTIKDYKPQEISPRNRDKEGFVEVVVESEKENLVDRAIEKLEWLIKEGVNLSDISFLVSTNRDGISIQDACYLKGYETSLKTSSSLKHIPKIASVVAMVDYMFNGVELDAMGVLERVGKDIKDIDRSWFNPFMQPMEVLHRVILDFGYFEDDLNLLKLLEFSSQFSDIPTFLEEFKLSSIDVSSNSKKGATIMTIHSSKGLQFDYVIVVDKLTGKSRNRATLIYDYNEKLHIRKVFYSIGKRENFDKYYKELLDKNGKLEFKDEMNLLYVALTRAIKGMVVISKEKGSIFDKINIKTLKIGSIEPSKKVIDKKSNSIEDIRLSHYGLQDIIDRKEEEEERDLASIMFGLALHYTLEMMSEFKLENIEKALISTKNRYGLELDREKFEDIKSRIENLILDSRFQNMLKDAKIKKEQSLSFEGQFKQIDLLLEYEDRFLVVDYKSSKKYQFKHIEQVNYYKRAVKEITKKSSDGVVIYLLQDRVEFMDI